MYSKQVFILIFLLVFSFSCKKNNKDSSKFRQPNEVFLKGEIKFEKGAIVKSLSKDKEILSKFLEEAYRAYLIKSGGVGDTQFDIFKILNKMRNFDNVKFWLTQDFRFKLELRGIDVIDIIETFSTKAGENDIQELDDFKFIDLSPDNGIILASKKDITVIAMKINLTEIFTYKEPKNVELLESIIKEKVKDDFDFYLAFSYEDILKNEKIPYFFQSFKSGVIKLYYDESKKENQIKVIANLGEKESVDAKIYLKSQYKKYLPIAIEKLKEVKKQAQQEEKNDKLFNKYQKEGFKMAFNVLKNIKISHESKYLNVDIKLSNLNREQARLTNVALVGILAAIAIPAYQSYVRKSMEYQKK